MTEHKTALSAFVAKKAEIDAMIERLKSLSDNHFGYDPDEINWGHVGNLEYFAELLGQVLPPDWRHD